MKNKIKRSIELLDLESQIGPAAVALMLEWEGHEVKVIQVDAFEEQVKDYQESGEGCEPEQLELYERVLTVCKANKIQVLLK